RDRRFESRRPTLAQRDVSSTEHVERRAAHDFEWTLQRIQIHCRRTVDDDAQARVSARQFTSAFYEGKEVPRDLLFPAPRKQREHLLIRTDSEPLACLRTRRQVLRAIQ